jgi:hypothetical protein
MGMDLVLWKAPVVDDPDEAERLLKPYYENGDESAFEPSADLTAVADELTRRFPNAFEGLTDDPTAGTIDRVLILSMSWSVSDEVLNAVVELARKHELVLYDPQGPDITLPTTTDPVDTEPTPTEKLVGYLKIVLMGAAAAGVFWLGWWIDVPVLEWVLMIVGGFFFSVVVFLLYILLFGPNDDKASERPAA